MSRPRAQVETPPLYATVHPGLEDVAGEEIAQELGGAVKRAGSGVGVFRVPETDRAVLRLRTTEDVFLYAWGTDALSYRAQDLDSIRRWTDRAYWRSSPGASGNAGRGRREHPRVAPRRNSGIVSGRRP